MSPNFGPPAPQYTYTNVASIVSFLGANGLTLRNDDNGTPTGTITAASNATPIAITSAAHGLVTGDIACVTGVTGNTWANGPWAVTYISANTFSLQQSVGVAPYVSGGTFTALTYPAPTWIYQACQVGTAKVDKFCQTLYDPSQLVGSWSVWNWATIAGAHWLCARRNNPIPNSLNNLYLEAMDELLMVQKQELAIEGTAYRNETQPTWAALRIDRRFDIKQMRVESNISGRVYPQFPRHWDLASQVVGPIELDSITI